MTEEQDRADRRMWAFLGPYIAVCVAIVIICVLIGVTQ